MDTSDEIDISSQKINRESELTHLSLHAKSYPRETACADMQMRWDWGWESSSSSKRKTQQSSYNLANTTATELLNTLKLQPRWGICLLDHLFILLEWDTDLNRKYAQVTSVQS